jgi:hypothetical protein
MDVEIDLTEFQEQCRDENVSAAAYQETYIDEEGAGVAMLKGMGSQFDGVLGNLFWEEGGSVCLCD